MGTKSKYNAEKIVTPDGSFDSHKEYERWCELKLLQKAGKISDLERQVKIELLPAQYTTFPRYSAVGSHRRLKDGRKLAERAVTYVADFAYRNESGDSIVEDAKGYRTPEYILKRKLCLFRYGIQIREV